MLRTVVSVEELIEYGLSEKKYDKLVKLKLKNFSLETIANIVSLINKYNLDFDYAVDLNCLSFEDFRNLNYLNKHLIEHENSLFIDEELILYPFNQAYEAEKIAKKVAYSILQKTKSPFEQLILAHDYASSKYYYVENTRYSYHDAISFIGSMTTKSIVCMGYAKIMQKICSNLGIMCYRFEGANKDYHSNSIHSFNIVHLVDNDYKIYGHYLLDATWDSNLSRIGERSYLYLLHPLQDCIVENAKHFKYLYNHNDYIETAGEYISTPLPARYSSILELSTIEKALNNLYKNKQAIESSLKYTTQLAKRREPNGENCFSKF